MKPKNTHKRFMCNRMTGQPKISSFAKNFYLAKNE